MSDQPKAPANMSRRDLLRRLGLAAGVAYVAPGVLVMSSSSAYASPSSPDSGGKPSSPDSKDHKDKPSGRVERDEDEDADESPSDHCHKPTAQQATAPASIDRSDIERAQASVDAGYAKPLNEIWRDIQSAYDGRIVEIEFTGFKMRPRFRMRAISPTGRLETVIVSARTGQIERIVGC